MILTAKIKLQPTPDQHNALLETLEVANAACDYASEQAWEHQIFRQYPLHHLVYRDIRECFSLGAQVAVRAIGKVADAYKLDKRVKRTFAPYGAFPYDKKLLSFKTAKKTVSIWMLEGRQHMTYLCGERQHKLLEGKRGEADLCYIDGELYLFVSCEVETPELEDIAAYLGIDLGIVNIASDSDGETFSGEQVEETRRKFAHRRRNLQRLGTRASKRKLMKIRHKQSRYQTDVNHQISKAIVQKAKRTGRGIALEILKGITRRVRVTRKQRARLHNWSFGQLASFVQYKAELAGMPVSFVDPKYTSQTCSECGHIDKRNRPDQATFSCVSCGFSVSADTNAAVNIAVRAVVNQPNELCAQGSAAQPQLQAPSLAAG
ncbi:MAG: transposase [Anaerolineales bacterium]|nr:transposase [Anaerolineales bacterium]